MYLCASDVIEIFLQQIFLQFVTKYNIRKTKFMVLIVLLVTLFPVGVCSIVISMSVCLSNIHSHISKTT